MHLKGQLCRDCKGIFERAFEREKALLANGETGTVNVPRIDYSIANLYRETRRGDQSNRHPISTPLFKLMMALSEPSEFVKGAPEVMPVSHGHGHEPRLMKLGIATLLTQLHKGIAAALVGAHADGHAEGRDLLMQLASGQITMDTFNERAARMDSTGQQ